MKTAVGYLLLIIAVFCNMFLLLYQTKITTQENFRKRFQIVQSDEEQLDVAWSTKLQNKILLGTKVLETRARDKLNGENGTSRKKFFSHIVNKGQELTAQNTEIQENQTQGTEFCEHVNMVRTKASSQTWQPIVPNDSYVYSAYIDNRFNGTVFTLITIENGHRKHKFTSYCHLWYENKALPLVIEATIEYWLGTGYRYREHVRRCKLPFFTSDITAVSLGRDKCGILYNLLELTPKTSFSMEANFTVCLGPLFDYKDENALTEFIEMHRILGVEKFAIYNQSIKANILPVLQLYSKLELIDLLPWTLPIDVADIYYHAQVMMMNDCLYRYMFKSKYIAFVDSDEMIIPREDYTWTGLVTRLEREQKRRKINTCGFLFQCMIFNTVLPDEEEAEGAGFKKFNFDAFKVTSLVKTKREQYIRRPPRRSKVIVNPRRVEFMFTHYVFSAISDSTQYYVPHQVAALHHYRGWPKWRHHAWVVDRNTTKYSKDLLQRIFKAKTQLTQN